MSSRMDASRSSPFLMTWLLLTAFHFHCGRTALMMEANAESDSQRLALFDFYGSLQRGVGWTSTCRNGWSTLGSVPPTTFCDRSTVPFSTFARVTCSSGNGTVTQLSLNNCNLSGSLTPLLSALTELQTLNLQGNLISGTLPPQWGTLTKLRALFLQSNRLSGSLPEEWDALSGLVSMYASNNRLTGVLPLSWSRLQKLAYLVLEGNQLTGSLPRQWWNLTNMDTLELSLNQLTGTLPTEWGAMTKLKSLYLFSNQLTGPLPSQWGNLSSLGNLRLHDNQLTGTLPSSWAQMYTLSYLGLYANHLEGLLPLAWQEGLWSISSNGFCGANCSGKVGRNAVCNGTTTSGCIAITLWYNCFDLATAVPAPNRSNNVFNWSSKLMNFGPQREDCSPPTMTRSHKRSDALLTMTLTDAVTVSRTTEEATFSITEVITVSSAPVNSASVSSTAPLPLPPTDDKAFLSPSKVLVGAVSSSGAMLASLAAGSGVSAIVQRASLQQSLMNCDVGEESDPLDIASNPLQLYFGTEKGQYIRGSVVGDLTVISAFGCLSLLALLGWWYHARSRQTLNEMKEPTDWKALLGRLQLPCLLHVPVMFFLQPIVSGSVWCLLQSNDEENPGDVFLGSIGLLLSLSYASWAVWICCYCSNFACEAKTVPKKVKMPTILQRLPVVVRCAVLGLQDHRTEWVNNKNGKSHATFFVERYGMILCAYRPKRKWFLAVDLLVVVGCGALSGSVTANPSWCNSPAPVALLLAAQTAMLLAVLVVQPYDDPADHVVGIVGLVLGLVWGVCTLQGSTEAAAIVTEVQLWLGIVTLAVILIVAIGDQGARMWLKRRLQGHLNHQCDAQGRTSSTVAVDSIQNVSLARVVAQICSGQQQQQQQQQRHNQQQRARRLPMSSSPQREPLRTPHHHQQQRQTDLISNRMRAREVVLLMMLVDVCEEQRRLRAV